MQMLLLHTIQNNKLGSKSQDDDVDEGDNTVVDETTVYKVYDILSFTNFELK
jgi:hypothetical protein